MLSFSFIHGTQWKNPSGLAEYFTLQHPQDIKSNMLVGRQTHALDFHGFRMISQTPDFSSRAAMWLVLVLLIEMTSQNEHACVSSTRNLVTITVNQICVGLVDYQTNMEHLEGNDSSVAVAEGVEGSNYNIITFYHSYL